MPVGNNGDYAERGGIIPITQDPQDKQYYILLGKNASKDPKKQFYNFPGGGIEQKDGSIAHAAYREAIEETGGFKYSLLAADKNFTDSALAKCPYVFSKHHHILLYFYLNNTLNENNLTACCKSALKDKNLKRCEREVFRYRAVALSKVIKAAQALASYKQANNGHYPLSGDPLYTLHAKNGPRIAIERHYLAVCAEDLPALIQWATAHNVPNVTANKRLGILLFKQYAPNEDYSIIVGKNSNGLYEIINDHVPANFNALNASYANLANVTNINLGFLDKKVIDPSNQQTTLSFQNPSGSSVVYFVRSDQASITAFEKSQNAKYKAFAAIPRANLLKTLFLFDQYLQSHQGKYPAQTDACCKTTSRSAKTPDNITLSIGALKKMNQLVKAIQQFQ